MDLRIIIVTHNSRSTIERCLSSLPDACAGMAWEHVVVDNASTDGTAESIPSSVRIANVRNRGFAAACNQGLSGSNARYVLLLNPDTVCPPGSLSALVREADARPRVGIFGPKLLNADGSVQASIRRFPGFWDQLGIMLKIHHLVPGLAAFRRYFAHDIPLDREAIVDQVMGACFLVRGELIDQIGGLDERYFVWFEEVDYCRMAKQVGWDTAYVPSVSVTHAGGHSFAQVFAVRKQRMFNTSLIAYAEKWWSLKAAAILRIANPVSIALAWLIGRIGVAGKGGQDALKPGHSGGARGGGWIAVILLIELVSALTIFNNIANSIALLIATGVLAAVSYKRPALSLSVLALELVIGSKGALLQVGGWPGTSLRICLFAAFFIGWAGNALEGARWRTIWVAMKTRWEWIALYAVVAYGIVRGIALQQPFLFADANAWGYALLAVPVFDIVSSDGPRLRRYTAPAILFGIAWLGVKTLALEYVFSHGFASIASDLYLWVRRTGVAEVTLITANAFRIFMQSYIWAMVGLLGAVAYVVETRSGGRAVRRTSGRATERIVSIVLISSVVCLLISLSRSMWMGTAAALVALVLFLRASISISAIARIARDGLIAFVLVATVILFPLPSVDPGSLKTLFGSRLSVSDDAAASRWNLWPAVTSKIGEHPVLGSGFGATVTYQSKDPRIVSQGKGGIITTYAFEWGWLEHWVKMGIVGLAVILLLVVGIGRRAWSSLQKPWIRYGSLAVLVGLAVTHFFTPYLNHPLGIGVLLLIDAMSVKESS